MCVRGEKEECVQLPVAYTDTRLHTVSLDVLSVHVQTYEEYLNTQNSTITLSLQLLHKLLECEELLTLYVVTSSDSLSLPVSVASILTRVLNAYTWQ